MRYGISIPNFAEPGALVEVAAAAEHAGWDGFFLWDHILVERDAPPMSEPWTVLAAVASITSRIRIGTLVTPVPRRRPWVLARQVTTVDHLSGGRAVLGVGLGFPPELEFGAFGESADPKEHGQLLDEGLDLIAALWSGTTVERHGRHFDVAGVRFLPTPIQRPRVPVWSAAILPARAGVRRAARWDGVAPIYGDEAGIRPLSPAEIADVVEEVQRTRTSPEPFDVVVLAMSSGEELHADYERAGATWLIEGPAPGPEWLDDARAIAAAGPPA